MPRDDDARVLDIVQSGRKTARFIEGVPRERFAEDDMRVSAVERQLEIIAEAATHLSDRFCATLPEVNWKGWRGLRLILAHAYHRAEVEILISTAYDDAPELLASLEPLLPKESD